MSKKKKKSKNSALGREIRRSNTQSNAMSEILSIISSSSNPQDKVNSIQYAILRCRSENYHSRFS